MSRQIGSRKPHLRPPSCRKLGHSGNPQDLPCVKKRDGRTLYPSLIACKYRGARRELRALDAKHRNEALIGNCFWMFEEERDHLWRMIITEKTGDEEVGFTSQREKHAEDGIGMPFRKSTSYLSECVGIQLLDDDTLIEILSRLSLEFLPIMKCVCKKWLCLINSNSFRNTHFQKSNNGVAGIFLQAMFYCDCDCCKDVQDYPLLTFVGIDKEGRSVLRRNMLDFLPEKVAVAASFNGLIICRSYFRRIKEHVYSVSMENPPHAELQIYVCNPLTKEFRVLKPNLRNTDRCALGLAFASNYFQVLVVQVLRKANDSFCYIFKIFSSKTNTWRVSKDKCYHSHRLLYQRHAFVNGVFYWLALGHSVLAFDLEKERSHIFKLPGPVLKLDGSWGWCIGVSEGKLHYVVSTLYEFMVWILNGDYLNPQWQLKYFRHVFNTKLLEEWNGVINPMDESYHLPNRAMNPMAFKDDVVFMDWNFNLAAYNIKTGDKKDLSCFRDLKIDPRNTPFVLPYSRSLWPVLQ